LEVIPEILKELQKTADVISLFSLLETSSLLEHLDDAASEIASIYQRVKTFRKPQPNSRCFCGSGRKYKHCCGRSDIQEMRDKARKQREEARKALAAIGQKAPVQCGEGQ
jgi:hypothetical protein